ncbi:hypothetical protein EDB92DRAFT_2106157 [Lactarius akahatsu]|uniref:Uncharacterized protein n=1 Tax=Lactarius akahatsu TaxID=416441 RepID=A0AAD4L8V2_9AGAM|nr:hypothetical protein EDB92DRAFT_2106157 [Lactarius akahatsu]
MPGGVPSRTEISCSEIPHVRVESDPQIRPRGSIAVRWYISKVLGKQLFAFKLHGAIKHAAVLMRNIIWYKYRHRTSKSEDSVLCTRSKALTNSQPFGGSKKKVVSRAHEGLLESGSLCGADDVALSAEDNRSQCQFVVAVCDELTKDFGNLNEAQSIGPMYDIIPTSLLRQQSTSEVVMEQAGKVMYESISQSYEVVESRDASIARSMLEQIRQADSLPWRIR